MTNEFVFYDLETAPEESKNLLGDLFDKNGRHGFYSVWAGSPEASKAYTELHELFMHTSFTYEERTVIW